MYAMFYSTHMQHPEKDIIAVEADLIEQYKWFQVRASKPEELAAPVFAEAEWIASVFKHEKMGFIICPPGGAFIKVEG